MVRSRSVMRKETSVSGPLPVLGRERIEGEELDAELPAWRTVSRTALTP
jgi:hypothetical protein